jgi:hypothetical protein
MARDEKKNQNQLILVNYPLLIFAFTCDGQRCNDFRKASESESSYIQNKSSVINTRAHMFPAEYRYSS